MNVLDNTLIYMLIDQKGSLKSLKFNIVRKSHTELQNVHIKIIYQFNCRSICGLCS